MFLKLHDRPFGVVNPQAIHNTIADGMCRCRPKCYYSVRYYHPLLVTGYLICTSPAFNIFWLVN